MCNTRAIASKSNFSFKHQFFCWFPQSPTKVSCWSQTLRPLGNLQGTSPGRRLQAVVKLFKDLVRVAFL